MGFLISAARVAELQAWPRSIAVVAEDTGSRPLCYTRGRLTAPHGTADTPVHSSSSSMHAAEPSVNRPPSLLPPMRGALHTPSLESRPRSSPFSPNEQLRRDAVAINSHRERSRSKIARHENLSVTVRRQLRPAWGFCQQSVAVASGCRLTAQVLSVHLPVVVWHGPSAISSWRRMHMCAILNQHHKCVVTPLNLSTRLLHQCLSPRANQTSAFSGSIHLRHSKNGLLSCRPCMLQSDMDFLHQFDAFP